MPSPLKQDVQSALEDFHPRIRRVVEKAWAEWRMIADFLSKQRLGPVLYPRTVANFVFDAIARYAVAEFASDPSVHVRVEAQTIKLFFKGDVLARFKKGDENKLGQNIETQAVLAFVDADGMLPGMPPETVKVEFIWLANDIQTRLDHVLVVARDSKRRLWEYEIEPATEATGTVIPFPTGPSEPTDSDDSDLVKPRAPSAREAEQEE